MRHIGIVALLCAALAAMPGCGFRPLYDGGNKGRIVADLSGVAIATIPERVGQMLRNELLDRASPYGETNEPRWLLQIAITEQLLGYGIQKDSTSTRASLRLDASFSLVDHKTGATTLQGSSVSINSFNILRQSYATASAEADARERAVSDLAEDIATRVALFIGAIREQGSVITPTPPAAGARP